MRMSKAATQREINHLLRRAGFGPSPVDLEPFRGLAYEAAVDRLVAGLKTPPPADPSDFNAYMPGAIHATWLERMRASSAPLAEKLALFWHGHFATSIRKVEDPGLMWGQMRTFRALGAGRFRDLVTGVSRDPAMVRWLDGNSNRTGAPNENYARELMELFTLGRGNYTERDVREAARAFTGWGAEGGAFVFRPEHHDAGTKTVLGTTGTHDGVDVIRAVTSRPECARFIAQKLLVFFSHPEPNESEVASAASIFAKTDGEVTALVRHILLSPSFRSAAAYRALVKSPAEFAVGAVRAVGLPAVPAWVVDAMGRMGQTLFAPPTVKGWDGGRAWLSSGALLERMHFAAKLAPHAEAPLGAIAVAFDGVVPAELGAVLASAHESERLALALASPEFQLN
jgi:uncharacterized protein (DUF1800 family)